LDSKTHIHKRNISVDTYEVGENTLMIEGELRDDRLMSSFVYSVGKFMEPGIIHNIIVRMIVSLPSLLIESAEAEMPTVPSEICLEVRERIEKIVGIQIKHGFTQQVMDSMGGTKGCIHMTNLILAMGSAAVQGQWAYYSRKKDDTVMRIPKFDPSLVLNSCWLWREDGPNVKRMKEIVREKGLKKVK
jgi:hypothetical protein